MSGALFNGKIYSRKERAVLQLVLTGKGNRLFHVDHCTDVIVVRRVIYLRRWGLAGALTLSNGNLCIKRKPLLGRIRMIYRVHQNRRSGKQDGAGDMFRGAIQCPGNGQYSTGFNDQDAETAHFYIA